MSKKTEAKTERPADEVCAPIPNGNEAPHESVVTGDFHKATPPEPVGPTGEESED
jgi:hypothetical protein